MCYIYIYIQNTYWGLDTTSELDAALEVVPKLTREKKLDHVRSSRIHPVQKVRSSCHYFCIDSLCLFVMFICYVCVDVCVDVGCHSLYVTMTIQRQRYEILWICADTLRQTPG